MSERDDSFDELLGEFSRGGGELSSGAQPGADQVPLTRRQLRELREAQEAASLTEEAQQGSPQSDGQSDSLSAEEAGQAPDSSEAPGEHPSQHNQPVPEGVGAEAATEQQGTSENQASVSASQQQQENRTAKPKKSKKKKGGVWKVLLTIFLTIITLAGLALGALYVFRDQIPYGNRIIQELEQLIFPKEPESNDYIGEGNGEEVLFRINEGEFGDVIANNLAEQGVIKTSEAFWNLLLTTQPEPVLYPGLYRLNQEMSAAAALETLSNPDARVENSVLIHEGIQLTTVVNRLSAALDIPEADFWAELSSAEALAKYGVTVPSGMDPKKMAEGYLFPATYIFDIDVTASEVVETMIGKTFEILAKHGVQPADSHRVLTFASIIQREAGASRENFYKVSRVFHNRIDNGWKLESDATVSYGVGRTDSLELTVRELNDTSNPYNTRANAGFPIGPISSVSELAIDAVLNPVDGPWFFFVTVNPSTGETVFSETFAQHDRAAEEYRRWCRQPENAQYCHTN